MKIDKEFQNIIPPLTEQEYTELESLLKKDGCRDAIIVWEDSIVDGHNRYKICTENNIPFKTIEKEFTDKEEVKLFIIKNQFARRNLPAFERINLALKFESILAEQAQQRMKSGNPTPKSEQGETAEKIGGIARSGKDTVYKVKVINEKATEEQKEKIRDGSESINSIYTDIKSTEKTVKTLADIEQQKKDIESGKIKLPEGVFENIVLDPPWGYQSEYNAEGRRSANKYPPMALEEIENIKLPTADDCILWFWTTQAFVFEAKRILDNWGFDYKGVLVWDKEKMGQGFWLRMQCEFCLMGVRGKPTWIKKDLRDIITEKGREHSRKPEAFYKMVEETSLGKRKLDYFSREVRKGWESYGNEPNKFVGK